jgi:DNA-directed RNA polymerase specialized sigma24 family protein
LDSGGDIFAHVAGLRRFARALVARDADDPRMAAEALVSATVERLDRSSEQARSGNLRIWLYATLTSLNRRRLRGASVPAPPTPSGPLGVTEAIACLPLECREPLLLVVLEGFSYAEAGDVLGIPKLGVGHRMARARHILDQHLEVPQGSDHRHRARPAPHLRVVK